MGQGPKMALQYHSGGQMLSYILKTTITIKFNIMYDSSVQWVAERVLPRDQVTSLLSTELKENKR